MHDMEAELRDVKQEVIINSYLNLNLEYIYKYKILLFINFSNIRIYYVVMELH